MRRRTFIATHSLKPLDMVQPLVQNPQEKSLHVDEECSVETPVHMTHSTRREVAMHACLVAFIAVSLLLVCLFGGKSPSSLLHIQGIKELIEDTPRTWNGEYIVFLSRSSGKVDGTHIAMGKSKLSPRVALSKAAAKIPREAHSYDWVKVDVVIGVAHKSLFDYANETPEMSSWWYGISLDWENGWVFLPDEVFSWALFDSTETLRWDHVLKVAYEKKLKGSPNVIPNNERARNDDIESTKIKIDFFQTKSVFCDFSEFSPEVIQLHHGHRMFSSVDSNSLFSVARSAAEYLSRSVTDSGRLIYQYKPRSDFELEGYHELSHAGTSFSMAMMYRIWKDPTLLRATTKSLQYLVEKTDECPLPYAPDKLGTCVVDIDDDGTKSTLLGVNSLLLLALCEFVDSSQDTTFLEVAKGLAHWISGTQRHDGSLVQKQQIEGNELDEVLDVVSCVGQAAFALAKLHNTMKRMGLQNDPTWSDVAIRIVEFVVDKEAQVEDEFFKNDSWMMYAIAEMRLWHINEGLIDFAMRGAKIARYNQHGGKVADDEDRDKFGIIYDETSAKKTAQMVEGLCAIYDIAVEQERVADQETILSTVSLAIRYSLQAQWRPEQAMYMKNPSRILGAFQESIYDRKIARNDYTQHSLAAVVCMTKILAGKDKIGNTWR